MRCSWPLFGSLCSIWLLYIGYGHYLVHYVVPGWYMHCSWSLFDSLCSTWLVCISHGYYLVQYVVPGWYALLMVIIWFTM